MDSKQLVELIHRYEAAYFTVTKRMELKIKELISEDLTLDQFSVLRTIHKHGRITATDLAELLCVGKSAITAITNRLFDKQMIERDPDPNDRRIVWITLTSEGNGLYEAAEKKINEYIASFLTYFDTEEIKTFIESLEKLAKLLQSKEGE